MNGKKNLIVLLVLCLVSVLCLTALGCNKTQENTPETYKIEFANGDEVLQTLYVKPGETPEYTGATPTKDPTAQYTYTFDGWDKPVVAANADTRYTAKFAQTVNKYTVTFEKDGGSVKKGEEEIDSLAVDYGTSVSELEELTVTKEHYDFVKWQIKAGENTYNNLASDATITENVTLKAVWKIQTFTITFEKDGGTIRNGGDEIDSLTLEYGASLDVLSTLVATKKDCVFIKFQIKTAEGVYADIDQDAVVTESVTIKAIFESLVIETTVLDDYSQAACTENVVAADGGNLIELGTYLTSINASHLPEFEGANGVLKVEIEHTHTAAVWIGFSLKLSSRVALDDIDSLFVKFYLEGVTGAVDAGLRIYEYCSDYMCRDISVFGSYGNSGRGAWYTAEITSDTLQNVKNKVSSTDHFVFAFANVPANQKITVYIDEIYTKQLAKLDTPTNVTVNDNTITWDEVENAEGYVVDINGTETTVSTNSLTVQSLPDDYEIKVKATARRYADSDFSETLSNKTIVYNDFSDPSCEEKVTLNIVDSTSNLTTFKADKLATEQMESYEGASGVLKVELTVNASGWAVAGMNLPTIEPAKLKSLTIRFRIEGIPGGDYAGLRIYGCDGGMACRDLDPPVTFSTNGIDEWYTATIDSAKLMEGFNNVEQSWYIFFGVANVTAGTHFTIYFDAITGELQ